MTSKRAKYSSGHRFSNKKGDRRIKTVDGVEDAEKEKKRKKKTEAGRHQRGSKRGESETSIIHKTCRFEIDIIFFTPPSTSSSLSLTPTASSSSSISSSSPRDAYQSQVLSLSFYFTPSYYFSTLFQAFLSLFLNSLRTYFFSLLFCLKPKATPPSTTILFKSD